MFRFQPLPLGLLSQLLLTLLGLANPAPVIGQARNDAPPFSLADQFGNTTEIHFPQPNAVVLIFTDRSGRAEARQWVTALGTVPPGKASPLRLVPVACTGWVPSLFQAQVRRGFAQAKPVLIDWNDAVAKQYGYGGTGCRVVAISAAGRIVAVADEPASPGRVTAILKALH